jgi:hypothetical protein
MKIYLNNEKYFDATLKNWTIEQNDDEIEILRQLLAKFINTINEMPLINPETGILSLYSIIENEYIFNIAIIQFCKTFKLQCELPTYMFAEKVKIIK